MTRALLMSVADNGHLSFWILTISLYRSSGGWPIRRWSARAVIALLSRFLVTPSKFFRTVSIILIPFWCSRRSMYGIPRHTPVSRLNTIFVPLGLVTIQSLCVCVGIPNHTKLSIETESISLPTRLSEKPVSASKAQPQKKTWWTKKVIMTPVKRKVYAPNL